MEQNDQELQSQCEWSSMQLTPNKAKIFCLGECRFDLRLNIHDVIKCLRMKQEMQFTK